MTDYVLPVLGNPNFKQLTWIKHPLQAYLRQFLGQWVFVKIDRDSKVLIVEGYFGPLERLQDGISRQAQAGHSHPGPGVMADFNNLEEIVSQDIKPIDETDKTLEKDIEVLQEILATEQETHEAALKELREEHSRKEGEYKLKCREADAACRDAEARAENLGKATEGLMERYSRQKESTRALERRITELEKVGKTPEELRIAAVRQSANNLRILEQQLESAGVSGDLEKLLAIPHNLLDYVNSTHNTTYQNEEAVRQAAAFKPAEPGPLVGKAYENARRAVRFYELVKSSGQEPPEEAKQLIAQLAAAYEANKSTIANFEQEEKQRSEESARAETLKEFLATHARATAARNLIAKAQPLEIYIQMSSPTDGVAYVPVGRNDSYIHRFVDSLYNSINCPPVDEDGVMRVNLLSVPSGKGMEDITAFLSARYPAVRIVTETVMVKTASIPF